MSNESLEVLVGREEQISSSNTSDNSCLLYYAISGSTLTSTGGMFTVLGLAFSEPWFFLPALGFGLAGVISSGYGLYRALDRY